MFATLGEVRGEAFVPLKCRSSSLSALAEGIVRFGTAEGAPDWLVSGVWLCSAETEFLATASLEVLGDGYLARPLKVDTPAELVAELESELPDIEGRLIGRGCDFDLSLPAQLPAAPKSLSEWSAALSSMTVLLRGGEHAGHIHRVACGLLFAADGLQLLVGTDASSLAMVFSQDPDLIGRYREKCDELSPQDYLEQTELEDRG